MVQATADDAGKVFVGGVQVTGAVITSAGQQASSGILLIDGPLALYFPSNATDIATTIQKAMDTITQVTATITKVANMFTAVGAGMTGPTTAPPPTLAADVAVLNTKVTALNAIKDELDELKGALK